MLFHLIKHINTSLWIESHDYVDASKEVYQNFSLRTLCNEWTNYWCFPRAWFSFLPSSKKYNTATQKGVYKVTTLIWWLCKQEQYWWLTINVSDHAQQWYRAKSQLGTRLPSNTASKRNFLKYQNITPGMHWQSLVLIPFTGHETNISKSYMISRFSSYSGCIPR